MNLVKIAINSRFVMSLISKKISVDKILLGGEAGIDGNRYSRLTGNILRSSTKAQDSPHLKLLIKYDELGDELFESNNFHKTDYYKNATEVITFCGNYFHATRNEEIVEIAKSFVKNTKIIFNGRRVQGFSSANKNTPIVVKRIKNSDYYELVDGNHRLARVIKNGSSSIKAIIKREKTSTPAQDMLLDVLWQGKRKELYQPLEIPEVTNWPVIRNCKDRAKLITDYLMKNEPNGLSNLDKYNAVDIGCSYGWFVNHFSKKHKINIKGVEIDPFAINIGTILYNLNNDRFIRKNVNDYLQISEVKKDIVFCFSVLHHYLLRAQPITPEEFIKSLDRITQKYLFIDTGQEHEPWFRKSLIGWNEIFIQEWIKKHTSFAEVIPLGVNQDSHESNGFNYARTLFVCVKK